MYVHVITCGIEFRSFTVRYYVERKTKQPIFKGRSTCPNAAPPLKKKPTTIVCIFFSTLGKINDTHKRGLILFYSWILSRPPTANFYRIHNVYFFDCFCYNQLLFSAIKSGTFCGRITMIVSSRAIFFFSVFKLWPPVWLTNFQRRGGRVPAFYVSRASGRILLESMRRLILIIIIISNLNTALRRPYLQ